MALRKIRVHGIEAIDLATQLLQRARLVTSEYGVFEAADVQWSWRVPRESDDADKLFWLDDHGPVAGVLLTSEPDGSWQCDTVIVPDTPGISPGYIWDTALSHASELSVPVVTIPVSDNDHVFLELARRDGFTAGDADSTAWMEPENQPDIRQLPEGYTIVDRSERLDRTHHLSRRNGEGIQERLLQCSLYDPTLDFVVETITGQVAGYSLYWFDPVTRVGLVEPVRVEDDFQRKGIARTMLSIGIDRLIKKGAQRIKVSYETEAAGALYESVGFRTSSTTTWYRLGNHPNR